MGRCASKTERQPQRDIVKETCFQSVEDLDLSTPQKLAGKVQENAHSSGEANKVMTLRSSHHDYSHSMAQAKLGAELERHGSDVSLIPRIFSSSLKKKPSSAEKIDTRRVKRNAGVKKIQKNSVKLSNRLKGLTKEQLTDMILQAAQLNPNFEKVFLHLDSSRNSHCW